MKILPMLAEHAPGIFIHVSLLLGVSFMYGDMYGHTRVQKINLFCDMFLKTLLASIALEAIKKFPSWVCEYMAAVYLFNIMYNSLKAIRHYFSQARRSSGTSVRSLGSSSGPQRPLYAVRYHCDWSVLPPAYAPPSAPETPTPDQEDDSNSGTPRSCSACTQSTEDVRSLDDQEPCCAICLDPVNPARCSDEKSDIQSTSGSSASVRTLRSLPCTHTFHADCIEQWLNMPRVRADQIACPVCKTAVPSRPVVYLRFAQNSRNTT